MVFKFRALFIYDCGYGTESHVLTLAEALEKHGYGVIPVRLPNFLGDKVSDKVTVKFILKFLGYFVATSFVVFKLLRIVKKEKPLIVHVHSPRIPLVLGYFVHIIGGIPLVITIHEHFSVGLRINRLYTRATRIIAVSPEIERQIQEFGVDKDKIVLIPNMVDTDLFSPTSIGNSALSLTKPHSSFKLLSMGRLDVRKELLVKTVMELMPRLVNVFPKIQLIVVGDGPRFKIISDVAKKINYQLGKNVIILLGRVNDVIPELRQSDIVIGVGRVAMEAMAFGKPVIVASPNGITGLTGAVVTKENALVLSQHNFSGRNYHEKMSPERLCAAIIELLKDEKHRKRVGLDGRNFIINNFETSFIAKKTELAYLDAVRKLRAY